MNCFNEITESNHSDFPLQFVRGVRQCTWMFLFTWFLCYPTAKNPKSMPLFIFRLTLHELPEWSTPWTVLFPVRFVSKRHLFIAGHKSGTRAEGLMLWTGCFVLKQSELQFAGESEASWKPVCGTRLGCIPSEGGKADRKWSVSENQVSQNSLVLFAGVSCVLKITGCMEINHCPVQAVLEGEIGVLVTVPCCRVFSWDDWYLRTVAVIRALKTLLFVVFFFSLYIVRGSISHQFVWNLSFLLEQLLWEKKKKSSWSQIYGAFLWVAFNSALPSSDGVGVAMFLTAWAVPHPPGSSFSRTLAEGSFSSTTPVPHPREVSCPANRSPVHFTGLVSLMVPLM